VIIPSWFDLPLHQPFLGPPLLFRFFVWSSPSVPILRFVLYFLRVVLLLRFFLWSPPPSDPEKGSSSPTVYWPGWWPPPPLELPALHLCPLLSPIYFTQHRKFKRLELGGGQANDRSSAWTAALNKKNLGIICCTMPGLTGLVYIYTFVHNISSSTNDKVKGKGKVVPVLN